MEKNQAVTDLFLAVVESWQQYKGGAKINPELADIIELHLNYAFICGFDEIATAVLKLIDINHDPKNYKHTVSINYLKEFINDKYKLNEIKPANP